MGEKGITHIEGAIDAIEVIAVAIKKIMKDGKIGADDITVVVGLIAEFQKLMDAFLGMKEAVAEGKEIDAEEAVALVGKLYAVAKKIQEA